MKPRFSWLQYEIGIVVLAILAGLFIAFSPANSLMHWYRNDDAFFYFKVATNAISGHGISFDGINRSNGFQPLWELVCMAVFWTAKYDLLLPLRILVILSTLLNAGTGVLLYKLLRKFILPGTAALIGFLWLFLPFIHSSITENGLESGLSVFLVVFLIYLSVEWRNKNLTLPRLVGLGIVAGLAILARLDNIFVVALLGVWFALGFASAYLRTVVTLDLAIIFIVGLLSNFIGLRTGKMELSGSASLPGLVGLGFVIQPILFILFGVYKLREKEGWWKFILRLVPSTLLATGLIGILLTILQQLKLFNRPPIYVILVDWLGVTLLTIVIRLLARLAYGNEETKTPGPELSWKYWQVPFQRSLGYFLPIIFLLGGYMAWSYLYFGTPLPVSGMVKYWWGSIYISLYGSVKNRMLSTVLGNDAWQLALSPLRFIGNLLNPNNVVSFIPILIKAVAVCLVLILLASQRRRIIDWLDKLGLLVVLAGLYAQIFSYTSTTYWDTRDWYWANETLFTMICLGILLECVYLGIPILKRQIKVWSALLVVTGVVCLGVFGNGLWHNFPYRVSQELQNTYLDGENALEVSTPPGSVIGIKGGGEFGYFIPGRTVVNLDGLINSYEYYQDLKDGKGAAFLDKIGLDFVIGYDYMLAIPPYHEMMASHLVSQTSFNDGTTLYRYVPSP